MKLLSTFLLMVITIKSFADVQIDGINIVDVRSEKSLQKEFLFQRVSGKRIKKGDFEGNGGDPLRLRYGMIYNHLKEINNSNFDDLLPPSSIFNYNLNSESSEIFLSKDSILIPKELYFEHKKISKIVDTLFLTQLISLERFYTDAKIGAFNNPITRLDQSISPGGLTDFNQRLSTVFSDMAEFLERQSFKIDNRIKYLSLSNFQLVEEDVLDLFGSNVCGIHVINYEVRLNSTCWAGMSPFEQRLLIAHEVFRIMSFKDDDYYYTYQFLKFKNYSEISNFDPFLN